jgi:hypothetical protein
VEASGEPELSLQLDPGLRLPTDTAVKIRADGLLGARYVELIPGHSSTDLRDGTVIHAPADALTYGVPDALDTFDRQTRGALGSLISQAGSGLLTNGQPLNDAIRLGAEQIGPFQTLVGDIFARPGALARLVPSLDATTSALAGNRGQLSALPGAIGRGLSPLATERRGLQGTLAEAPSALSTAKAGLGAGGSLLAALSGLSQRLDETLPGAPSALQETTRLLIDSRRPLVIARGLVAQIPSAVPSVLRITHRLSPLLPHASAVLRPLIPMLGAVALHGCDVTNFAAGFRSMTGIGGACSGPIGSGGEFRLELVVPAGAEALGIPGASAAPLVREGYSPPCKYTNISYGTFPGLAQTVSGVTGK